MERTVTLYCSAPVIATGITSVLGDAEWTVSLGQSEQQDYGSVVIVFVRSGRGIIEVREIRRFFVEGSIVAITDNIEADLTAELVAAGATTVIGWDSDPEILRAAMELALHQISAIAIPALRLIATSGAQTTGITDAERRWLEELEGGITVSKLAPIAGYSERSLYRQLNQLYHRLGASNRAEAIAEARRRELM